MNAITLAATEIQTKYSGIDKHVQKGSLAAVNQSVLELDSSE